MVFMDNKLKMAVFASAIISIILLVLILGTLSRIQDSEHQNTQNAVLITQNDKSWPMFRGSQGLLGRAEGELPDSLELLWKFKTDGPVKSSPIIDSNLVFVGSNDENIYAIDLHNGNRVWAYKTDDSVEATPLCIGGTVYAGSSGGFLYAIEARTGKFKWKYETDGQILGAANWTYSPDGKNIWIIVGSYDNFLHCVNSKTGKLVWKYKSDYYINGSPAVEGKFTVFGGCDEVIHVISLSDGKQTAKIEDVSYIAASAAILDGQVYVGNYDNVFLKADIRTEKILWEYTESDAPFFSSPAIGDDRIVVGSRDEHVHCINRNDGKKIWTFATLDEVDSSPVICGDKVVVGSADGRIYMIKLSDGSQIWSYETGQGIASSPAVVEGTVIIGCDDGYVYAFGKK
jgi:outer membrane protein assembly factor BamB